MGELSKRQILRSAPLIAPYISLLLFMLIYWSRPGDWISGLSGIPVAKVVGTVALSILILSFRRVRSLPHELVVLVLLTLHLFLASIVSTVWRMGAIGAVFEFSKILIPVFLINVAVNTSQRLHGLMLVQTVSVAAIAGISIWKAHLLGGRLEGVLGGDYSNPNDLALVIVVSLPICLALLFLAKNRIWKILWFLAMATMGYTLFLTGSRGGFLAFMSTVALCLWEFAILGRRRYLLILTILAGVVLWQSSGGMLARRFNGTFDSTADTASSYGSAQERQHLLLRSVQVTLEHPLLGVGPGNFPIVSGSWRVTHNAFTQMSSEGGLPAVTLYILILYYGIRNVRSVKGSARTDLRSKLLARALEASLAGYAVGALFASTAYEYFPYFLVAYTTSLLSIAKNSVAYSKMPKSLGQISTQEQVAYDNSQKAEWP